MAQPTLLILAAGMGSRYGGLKQVDPVGPSGETILDYSVYDAVGAGFGKVVFVIRRNIEEIFKEKVGKRYEGRIPVDYVFQSLDDLPGDFAVPAGREKPWGTAHAVWAARDVVRENFAVVNADDYYGQSSYKLLGDYLARVRDGAKAEYSMVGYVLGNTLSDHGDVNRAVCNVNAQGELEEAVETLKIEHDPANPAMARYPDGDGFKPLSKATIVSMNMFGFTPSIFGHMEHDLKTFLTTRIGEAKSELYIPTVVNKLIEEGRARMRVLPSQESWFGVTHAADKPHVVAAIRKLVDAGKYPEKLWA